MRQHIFFAATLLLLLCPSCNRELPTQSVAGYIVKADLEQAIVVEVTDSASVKLPSPRKMSFAIDDNTIYQSNGVIEGNIVEVVYQPAHKQTTFTALEITTDDTFPRALGRWSNGEHNRFKIDIELLPNGNIAQHLPSQTVEFKQWQLSEREDTITISGEVSLPPIIKERSKKTASKPDSKNADEQESLPPARRKMEFTTTAAIGIDGDRRTLTILTDKKGQSVLYRNE